MTHPRNEVCRAIASLSSSCTLSEVETVLEPLFQEYGAKEHMVRCNHEEGMAPLIVACDKGNVACLQYLWGKVGTNDTSSWISTLIGKPLDKSPDHGNSAIHHAAMAGCVPAIALLAQMLKSQPSPILALGTVRNTHGDTPLMMAAAAGHVDFCKKWQELYFQDNPSTVGKSDETVRNAWKLKNDSKDSCLSLACTHGHREVVEFLLSAACAVYPDSHEIMQSQILYQKMEAARRLPPSLTQAYHDQIERVLVCIEMLQVATTQAAEMAAQELLGSEVQSPSVSKTAGIRFQTRNKPKAKKNKSTKAQQPTTPTMSSDQTSYNDTLSATEPRDAVELMTLSDGTRAVRVAGAVEVPEPTCNIPTSVTSTGSRPHRSADDLFRERFQQSRICSEVDSVMQALCLEMSMLLYTPHGMAIDLSPSQLDAIQDILEKQILAVKEARTIQQRLHNT